MIYDNLQGANFGSRLVLMVTVAVATIQHPMIDIMTVDTVNTMTFGPAMAIRHMNSIVTLNVITRGRQ